MELTGITYSNFWDLLTDAAFFALQAYGAEAQQSSDGDRHVRASILSAALSLECAANRCIDSLKLPSKTADDFDKLAMLGKFDLYLGFSQHVEVLDRGSRFVQPIRELKAIRDAMAHPKRTLRPCASEMVMIRSWSSEYTRTLGFLGYPYSGAHSTRESPSTRSSRSTTISSAIFSGSMLSGRARSFYTKSRLRQRLR